MSKWTITYGNDSGPMDEGFWQWWDVESKSDGISFRCDEQEEAARLCLLLNTHDLPPLP